MNWLLPTMLATLMGTFFLALLYSYFYQKERHTYMKAWAASWYLYAVQIVFEILDEFLSVGADFFIVIQIASLCTAVAQLHGTRLFVAKRFPRTWYWYMSLILLIAVIAGFLGMDFPYRFIMVSIAFAGANIYTGIEMIRSTRDAVFERIFTGVALILWGLHHADYPWLRHLDSFTPWGFLIATGLEFAVGTGMALLYFQRIKDGLNHRSLQIRTIIETIPDIVWLKDVDGHFLFCNRRFAEFYGVDEKTLIGKTDYDLVEKAKADSYRRHDLAAMASFEPLISEESVTFASDGHVEIIETTKTAMRDANQNVLGVLGVARDITGRKRLSESISESHKLESLGRLAGGISHDFNNFLSPIIGISSILLEEVPPDDGIYESIRDIYNASLLGRDLVKQVLTLSRKGDKELAPTFLHQVITDALKLSRSAIPDRISIKVSIDESCPQVLANVSKIHQVAMNLVTNAYHAVDERDGRIEISLHVQTVNERVSLFGEQFSGDYVVLSVADNGHGIDPKIVKKVFDPYFTTKAHGKGTGLGLAIVLGIIEEHAAEIEVDSVVGRGTVVKVYFPVLRNDGRTNMMEQQATMESKVERILVVDDEKSVASLVEKILTRVGYQVDARTSPEEAMALFSSNTTGYDAVITDLNMPDMMGDELSAAIKKIDKDIPIALCTGFYQSADMDLIEAGCIDAVIEKPISASTIVTTVRKLIGERSRRR